MFPGDAAVLHREAADVVRDDLASVLQSLRGWQLGPKQGLPVHHPHLQRLDLAGTLRSFPLLLWHQGSLKAVRSHPQVLHHQVSHLLVFLAR